MCIRDSAGRALHDGVGLFAVGRARGGAVCSGPQANRHAGDRSGCGAAFVAVSYTHLTLPTSDLV